ncbi:MAG: threonylcarbamoyl-AMP synthase [Methylococcales symbiont of Hymedesmia sp. n. MRB-2018]|nr:MAG: threonylcarbamoyl-AMP synthase [Methylococcales symbiont of Hymedesmia sp. n. MRB-2018]KAF3983840.1 MAG: threonylcarbamoyl-AMP synthase [Methylococcales symbiont of Hymedesmia sp. n. MRB-2018]
MAQYFQIHPSNPQKRLIYQAVEILNKGGLITIPTDSSYAIACHLGDKRTLDAIRRIRQLSNRHNFTLVCKGLTQVSNFTKINNEAYRLIKSLTPGAFTFLLDATKEVPRRLQHPKKKTVGIRIPDNIVIQMIVEELAEPLFSSTLILPDQTEAETDPEEIRDKLEHELDLIIDCGIIESQETTVIDCCSDNKIEIIRQGIGIAPMLDK